MTFQEVERSKFIKSEKVKKDVSGGGEFIKSEKMMRKHVSGGQR